jgi:hypothetical protein
MVTVQSVILPLRGRGGEKEEEKSCLDAQFEVLTAVLLRIQAIWDVSHCVAGCVVPNVLKECSAFIFRSQAVQE